MPSCRCSAKNHRIQKATEYFLLIGFLFTYLIGRALNFALLFDWPHKDVLQSLQSAYAQLNPYRGLTALYAFVLGHYLMAYPLPKAARRLLYAAGCLSCLMTILLTRWHSTVLPGHQRCFHLRRGAGRADDDGGALRLQGAAPDPGAKAQRALLLVSKCNSASIWFTPSCWSGLISPIPVAAGCC